MNTNRECRGRWTCEAEIERLRRDLEIWKHNGGNDLMRTEIERLQAWLYLISHWPVIGDLRDMARSALAGKPAPEVTEAKQ